MNHNQQPPESSRRNYHQDEIEAARRVLAELADLLSEHRHGIVLVGGWTPFFAVTQDKAPHEGTKDIDLVLDQRALSQYEDETLEEILSNALYQQDPSQPFRWHRMVDINGAYIDVIVDFLAGEIPGYPTGRLQRIQDLLVSTLRGCDLATLNPQEVNLEGLKPDGSPTRAKINVVSLPYFIAMKGLALHNRYEASQSHSHFGADARKDASDIYYIVRNVDGGPISLATMTHPLLENALLREGLEKIAAKWKSHLDIGPTLIAEREMAPEENRRLRRDAFEQVNAFLAFLNLSQTE